VKIEVVMLKSLKVADGTVYNQGKVFRGEKITDFPPFIQREAALESSEKVQITITESLPEVEKPAVEEPKKLVERPKSKKQD
jgi:DNA-binding transcriptional regulator of glucitol operon